MLGSVGPSAVVVLHVLLHRRVSGARSRENEAAYLQLALKLSE